MASRKFSPSDQETRQPRFLSRISRSPSEPKRDKDIRGGEGGI